VALPARPGFVAASFGILGVLLALVALHRELFVGALRAHRALLIASGAVVLSRLVSSAFAEQLLPAVAEAARAAAVLVTLFVAAVIASVDRRVLAKSVALAAAVVIFFNLAVFIVGALVEPFRSQVFELWGGHQNVGALPRFRGLYGSPFVPGFQLLLMLALVQGLESAKWRWLATLVGSALVLATLSFAAVCLPIGWAWSATRRPAPRLLLTGMAALAAVTILWVQPLRVVAAGQILLERAPIAGWFREGLGPRHMPRHEVHAPGLDAELHFTGYFHLFIRGFTCFAEHPLAGVGGRGFVDRCPVMTMNTYGGWATQRSAHTEYGGLAAEHGALGILSFTALVLVLTRRYRWTNPSPLATGLVVAYVVSGFAGPVLFQIPFAVLLALSLTEPRRQAEP
jgi:hypothetical protein